MAECKIDGCGGIARKREWCQKHYNQWRRNHAKPCKALGCDKPSEVRGLCMPCYRKGMTKGKPVCSFLGCNKQQMARGLCSSCYARNWANGTPNRLYDGRTSHPLYSSWNMMKQRCSNENTVNYKYYGGAGISVCDRWGEFWNFVADMGGRPSQDHTLERLDNSGDYEPGNCCWATPLQQSRNKRNTKLSVEIVYQIKARHGRGEKCTDIAKSLAAHYQTVNSVINKQSWKDIEPRIFD